MFVAKPVQLLIVLLTACFVEGFRPHHPPTAVANQRSVVICAAKNDHVNLERSIRSFLAAAATSAVVASGCPAFAADDVPTLSFQEQLRVLQTQKVEQQKKDIEVSIVFFF